MESVRASTPLREAAKVDHGAKARTPAAPPSLVRARRRVNPDASLIALDEFEIAPFI